MNYRSPDYMIDESARTGLPQEIDHRIASIDHEAYSWWVHAFLRAECEVFVKNNNVFEYIGSDWRVKITVYKELFVI